MIPRRANVRNWLIAGVVGVLANAPAFAAQYACSGPVNGVTVGPSGMVAAESAGGQHWGYFCQLGATVNGVSPESCKGILAILLTAQSSGKSIQLRYNDSIDCSTHLTQQAGWTFLSTWYWGPEILN